jgi:murein DD-endopeptidase MepM/ murein hydrolase activator NlpD
MPFKLIAAALLVPAISPFGSSWQMPFQTPHALVRPYLQPNSDYSAGHRGIDLAAELGEVIFAPADGEIRFSGKLVDRGVLSINHAGAMISELEPICSSLKPGETVKKGQPVGSLCKPDAGYKTHCPRSECVHFSLRIAGAYASPQALIGGLNPSRLLPYARG